MLGLTEEECRKAMVGAIKEAIAKMERMFPNKDRTLRNIVVSNDELTKIEDLIGQTALVGPRHHHQAHAFIESMMGINMFAYRNIPEKIRHIAMFMLSTEQGALWGVYNNGKIVRGDQGHLFMGSHGDGMFEQMRRDPDGRAMSPVYLPIVVRSMGLGCDRMTTIRYDLHRYIVCGKEIELYVSEHTNFKFLQDVLVQDLDETWLRNATGSNLRYAQRKFDRTGLWPENYLRPLQHEIYQNQLSNGEETAPEVDAKEEGSGNS